VFRSQIHAHLFTSIHTHTHTVEKGLTTSSPDGFCWPKPRQQKTIPTISSFFPRESYRKENIEISMSETVGEREKKQYSCEIRPEQKKKEIRKKRWKFSTKQSNNKVFFFTIFEVKKESKRCDIELSFFFVLSSRSCAPPYRNNENILLKLEQKTQLFFLIFQCTIRVSNKGWQSICDGVKLTLHTLVMNFNLP
jgi:hypothetical protein